VSVVTVGSLLFHYGTITAVAQGLTLSTLCFTPMSLWFLKAAKLNASNRPANIFYEDGLS